MKELARMSVQQKLEQYGIYAGKQITLHDTDPAVPTLLATI
jgi:hypothetical protein